mmetsp:Transcript_91981/g.213785  ORF Transcript_91981/g.213785 Transcript_91981/m.213785 type:complete len:308 (+) Transcript_91981:96-1019(+)|eukprot:CAMPEP_0171095912 /NCGR_PEP_ID=MMETSP0766_2-20121228/43442_1 /TAXON_ID=439317 /ORGANISM="Gambierdiscus australes, Strain CAWD 149" /LENGTH=307 /DNA_ID=CAMNT_0011554785 /DNA_START=96 /DNA_END=1019 /DNA_ORIENTATION=+
MASVKERAGDIVRREVAPFVFALFIFLFIRDAVHNRLGSSNGRFISFIDTIRSVAQYRSGLPDASRQNLCRVRLLFIAAASFLVKFASTSLVSILFGKMPIVLSGPRHTVSFFIGFLLVWLSPQDLVYTNVQCSRAVRLMLDMGGGLYKMRKVIFAVEAATTAKGGLALAVLVAVLAVDGTTLTRRGMHWLEKRWAAAAKEPEERSIVRRISGDITFRILWQDSGKGARQTLLSTVLPIGVVTALVWVAAIAEWASGITDDSFLYLRSALLTLFIWRAGAFYELSMIHAESIALAESVEALKGKKAE